MIKIKADIMWAFLDRQNDMSNAYQVDLCNLSEKAVKALTAMGVAVRTKEGKGSFITCKSQRPIRAYDDGGSEIEGSVVGNGSESVALVDTYNWQFKGKKGTSPTLKRLVITNLKVYEGGSAGGDEAVAIDDDDTL